MKNRLHLDLQYEASVVTTRSTGCWRWVPPSSAITGACVERSDVERAATGG